ncbi:MAG: T9SS type A sorting domain-containing protein [Saprospiraceae bacterium]|nr:T9SS type A sorting domain-containing protein [Saprospiraceae bacterium]
MKNTLYSAIFLVIMFSFYDLSAQVNENDPLNSVRHLISEDEIILLWNQTDEPSNTRQKHATFLDFVPGPANTNLNNLGTSTDFGTFFGTYGTGSMDVATGYLFGSNPGSTEGTVQCWRGEDGVSNNKVVLEIGDPLAAFNGTLDYPRSTVFALKNLMPSSSSIFPQVRVVAGNFNTDNNDEIILVYQADDGVLAMEHYEPSKPCPTCEPEITLVATQTGPAFSNMGNPIKTATFDLSAGDVDADGYDELILAHIKAGTSTLTVSIYDIDNFGAMTLKTSKDVFNADFTHITQAVGATAGDYNAAFAGDEFAVACRWGITSGIGNPNDPDTRLYTMRLKQSGTPEIIVDATNTSHYFSTTQFNQTDGVMCLGMASGDLDGDLNEDVVLNVGSQVWMFKVLETNDANAYMIPEQLGSFSHNLQIFQEEGRYSNNILAVGNVDDLNGNFGFDFRSEILIGRNRILPDDASNNKQQGFFLNVYGFNSDPGNPSQINFNSAVLRNKIENLHDINDESDLRRYALAMGDFNGGSVLLGEPNVTVMSDVLTPLVVINAPPTHFAFFNNTPYDVCNIYGVGDPAPPVTINHFNGVYEEITANEFTFETRFTTDWAVSTSVEAGFSASGFDLGAKFTRSYGERFSKVDQSSSSITITQKRSAILDDELLAYTVEYVLYEYPVYNSSNPQPITHVMVVMPRDIDLAFTGARSPVHRYQLSHHHGNLFSYPKDLADLELEGNPGVYEINQQEISKFSGFDSNFSVEWTDATASGVETEETTKTEVGVNAGGAFKGFSLGASVNGTYASSDVNTKTSKYQENVKLSGYFGQGEISNIPGDYNYSVKPVIYWGLDGSLTLDYLVEIANIGFWQNFYSSYDPAFLLPFQLEPEKGNTQLSEATRYLTRDILVTPFPQGGNTVTLRARIHNYGFDDTPNNVPVEVCFFNLDPLATAIPQFIGCAYINQSIRGRINEFDYEIVEMPWVIPQNVSPNTKIIAVIDPNNELNQEVHDYPLSNGISNNVGWRCLFNNNCTPPDLNQLFSGAVGAVTPAQDHMSWRVSPNPVSDQCVITSNAIDLNNFEGSFELFDLHGRLVRTWQSQPGTDAYQLDMFEMPSGLYTLRILQAGKAPVGVKVVKS